MSALLPVLPVWLVCYLSYRSLALAWKVATNNSQHSVFDQALALSLLTSGKLHLNSPPQVCLHVCSCLGLLAPVAFWSNLLLLALPDNSPSRPELCTSLILARNTIWILNANIFSFAIHWRSFLILHSEKGFVDKGRPNLKLFNQLYWVVVFTMNAIQNTMFPINHIAKGGFPENSHKGRVCLLLEPDHMVEYGWKKYKLFPIVFTSVALLYMRYIHLRVKRFLKGICPNKSYSCIMPYQRNILNFKTSLVWADFELYYGIFDLSVLMVLNEFRSQMSSKTEYLIWNTYSSILNEVLHLLIPLVLVIPESSRTGPKQGEFYVRRPVLEPRRPASLDKVDDSWTRVILVREASAALSAPSQDNMRACSSAMARARATAFTVRHY